MTKKNIIILFSTLFIGIAAVAYQFSHSPDHGNESLVLWELIYIPLPTVSLFLFQVLFSHFKQWYWDMPLQILIGMFVILQSFLLYQGLMIWLLTTIALMVFISTLMLVNFQKVGKTILSKKNTIILLFFGFISITFPFLYAIYMFATHPFSLGIL